MLCFLCFNLMVLSTRYTTILTHKRDFPLFLICSICTYENIFMLKTPFMPVFLALLPTLKQSHYMTGGPTGRLLGCALVALSLTAKRKSKILWQPRMTTKAKAQHRKLRSAWHITTAANSNNETNPVRRSGDCSTQFQAIGRA